MLFFLLHFFKQQQTKTLVFPAMGKKEKSDAK